jgi:hypothetical protein
MDTGQKCSNSEHYTPLSKPLKSTIFLMHKVAYLVFESFLLSRDPVVAKYENDLCCRILLFLELNVVAIEFSGK